MGPHYALANHSQFPSIASCRMFRSCGLEGNVCTALIQQHYQLLQVSVARRERPDSEGLTAPRESEAYPARQESAARRAHPDSLAHLVTQDYQDRQADQDPPDPLDLRSVCTSCFSSPSVFRIKNACVQNKQDNFKSTHTFVRRLQFSSNCILFRPIGTQTIGLSPAQKRKHDFGDPEHCSWPTEVAAEMCCLHKFWILSVEI